MTEPTAFDENEKRLLEYEYRELNADWRMRDGYVLTKLGGAGIIFSLLGLAVANLGPDQWGIKVILAAAGAFYSMILCISVAKDVHFRDSTGALLKHITRRLDIIGSIKKDLGADEPVTKAMEKLDITRKLSIALEHTSLKKACAFPPYKWMIMIIDKQTTFLWILSFYVFSFLAFLSLFIMIFVDRFSGIHLPI